jgi:hypothetical protein
LLLGLAVAALTFFSMTALLLTGAGFTGSTGTDSITGVSVGKTAF